MYGSGDVLIWATDNGTFGQRTFVRVYARLLFSRDIKIYGTNTFILFKDSNINIYKSNNIFILILPNQT